MTPMMPITQPTASIRIALVDDHAVVRRGLRALLESYADLTVVGEASSGEEALREMEAWLPDVVVMDLLMPGGLDGIEAIRRVRALTPHTRVVALTSATEDARVVAALRAGAIAATCARTPTQRCSWRRYGRRRADTPCSTRQWRAPCCGRWRTPGRAPS